ncbi:MAG: glycosyltransferase 61 family protein [Acetobacteraceae bacterium]
MTTAASFRNLQEAAAQAGSTITYIPLSDRADSLPVPPRFTFGPFASDLASRYYHEVLVLGTGLFVAKAITLSGHFLLSQGETIFACDQLHLSSGVLAPLVTSLDLTRFSRRTRIEPGRCVMLLGPGLEIYGHWLVDFLPKLYVLHAAGYDIETLRYALPADTPAFGLALLHLLGIGEDQLILYDPLFETVLADELLIPTMVRTNSRAAQPFADAATFLGRRINDRHGVGPPSALARRLYISRARSGRQVRRLLNRERIEQLAQEVGFSVVHPEHLPLLDQIRLFQGATHIMGEYGSALHAAIVSPPGTIVCALRGSGSPIAGFLQSSIGYALRQPTGYIIGPARDGDRLESYEIAERDFALCRDLVFGGRKLQS